MASVRLATPDDAAAIQAIYAPIVTDTIISFEIEPPSIEEMRERILRARNRWPWLVYESEEEVAGYACAGSHRERAVYRW